MTRIVIVGAGVAGCIMARGLAKLPDCEVTCLERVARDDHSESGTGLNVGPNAVKALATIDPDLVDRIAQAALPWKNWRVSLTDGTVLFDLPMGNVTERFGWRIRWSELYRVLREAAGAAVTYDCKIESVGHDPHSARKTTITWTKDGAPHTVDDIDLLIAGDGRYSQVRRSISGEPAINQVGVCIFRVLVPDTSEGLIDDYEQWFNGPNRLLAFSVLPGHVYIAGTFPIDPGKPIADHLKTAGALRAAYTPKDKPPSAQAQWMIDRICDNVADTHWARMQEHELLYAPDDCNVLYLGDAAHGMVPTLGQGGTQAIEDASSAVALITRAIGNGERDIRKWLSDFDTLRRERLRFIMEFSLASTDAMLEGADPVACTRHKTEAPFLAKLKTLYHDVGLPLN